MTRDTDRREFDDPTYLHLRERQDREKPAKTVPWYTCEDGLCPRCGKALDEDALCPRGCVF
jgi:hypothetical protein